MATREQIERSLQRMRAMSAADISVLDACSKTPESNVTTAPASPNEALWTEFVGYGWMKCKEDTLDLPGGKRLAMKIYSITAEGQQPILGLLSAIAQN